MSGPMIISSLSPTYFAHTVMRLAHRTFNDDMNNITFKKVNLD